MANTPCEAQISLHLSSHPGRHDCKHRNQTPHRNWPGRSQEEDGSSRSKTKKEEKGEEVEGNMKEGKKAAEDAEKKLKEEKPESSERLEKNDEEDK